MHMVSRLFNALRGQRRSSRRQLPQTTRPRRPAFDLLEDRTVPSTVSSIAASFNGSTIPAGDTIWFNSVFQASGLPKNAAATIHVDGGAIDFTVGSTPYHVAVPNGVIVLTPGAS